jgi:beta-ureidopropionase / N-carbamoyl-L-amino-acid hydrolase
MMTSHPALRPASRRRTRGPRLDPASLRVNGDRLLHDIDSLAKIGAGREGTGISRPGFSPAEDAAREFMRSLAARSGLATRVDAAGNLIASRSGHGPVAPALVLGSHLDTVVNGGRLDGAYGVLAAFEVLRVLAEQGVPTTVEPVAVAFSNEEGALYPCPFFGSRAYSGLPVDVDCPGRDDVPLRGPLARAGGDPGHLESASAAGAVFAYLELHIEQGPVLENDGVPIGIVNSICGRTILDIDLSGQTSHAGTTPMTTRADALAAAARVMLAVEAVSADRRLCAVSTTGRIEAHPNVTNVIPGEACLSAEIRDGSAAGLAAAEEAILADISRISVETGVRIEAHATTRSSPVRTDSSLFSAIAHAAAGLNLKSASIASGAGHDAQIIARIAPIGMIFVPSRAGLSHAPGEDTSAEHLVAGADVLLQTALKLSAPQAPERPARR